MKTEIEKYAEIIGVTVEDATALYDSIVSDNELDVNTEDGLKIARSLFRQNFSQARSRMQKESENDDKSEWSGETYTKKAIGFFYAVEQARNWEEDRRTTLLAEYQRDAEACLNSGKVAVAVQLSDGRYEVTRMKEEGELFTHIYEKLPDVSPMEIDEDKWLIPIDNRKAFANGQSNREFGRPRPAETWSRRLFFVGKVDEEEEYTVRQVRISGEQSKDFCPTSFKWCEFLSVPKEGTNILNARRTGETVSSLTYVDSTENILEILQTVLDESISALGALETYHNDNSHKQSHERIVITDGNVANMNLQLTSNGNRILFISDLNADFDYDGEGYSSTVCWIPDYVDIDFGIGSNVIVTGRTSQREVDGVMSNVSINVLGLHVVDRHGSADVIDQPTEDDFEWY